ncbi:hypothetical protein SM124_06425 [Bacillus sp. 31A1R]|uniref:Lipoprotein n=1 Tax=Robertmurraya mangrovi TaxID=3098077 RepID=A0ABU5IW44_9BACI|nr:hypothetical protein [Bacillus sp. 31A1R]MDZ5471379.1 hypothetical protein [Bacillus sp. 31A1R]
MRGFLVCFIAFMFISGCSNVYDPLDQFVKVEKQVGTEEKYEEFRRITEKKKVEQVRQILYKDTKWEDAKVSMSRPHNFQVSFHSNNPNVEAKKVYFYIWISPEKNRLEISTHLSNQYSQLTEKQSSILYELLTGEKLVDLNK